MGFFGLTVEQERGAGRAVRTSAQPRFRGTVDLDLALRQTGDVVQVWQESMLWPEAPPYSGGTYDAWPARMVRGLAICRAELLEVRRVLEAESHG